MTTAILKRKNWYFLPILAIMALGLFLTVKRFIFGLGSVTALSDQFPWGLWVGFDVVTGVAVAAGGFIMTGIVYLFNAEKYRPILRPAILTAFLGYILVCLGLMYDLGKPYNIWHATVMWNPHSVMFEVAWCVMLYTSVLALEFGSIVAEAARWKKVVRIFHAVAVPLVLAGVLLSTLHQSSLGSLFLIVPEKLHPLWYSSLLPLNFWLSAVAVGFATVILESYTSSKLLKRGLELDLLVDLGSFLWFSLIVYLAVRFQDLIASGRLASWAEGGMETTAFTIEIGLLICAVILLSIRRIHNSKLGLFVAALCALLGIVLNRMNVSVIGLLRSSEAAYFPAWSEIALTVFLAVNGFVIFFLTTRFLPIFPPEKKVESEWI